MRKYFQRLTSKISQHLNRPNRHRSNLKFSTLGFDSLEPRTLLSVTPDWVVGFGGEDFDHALTTAARFLAPHPSHHPVYGARQLLSSSRVAFLRLRPG